MRRGAPPTVGRAVMDGLLSDSVRLAVTQASLTQAKVLARQIARYRSGDEGGPGRDPPPAHVFTGRGSRRPS